MTSDASITLGREIAAGATILGPTGRDITAEVRAAFHRILPACGGDQAAAASQAVASVLAAVEAGDAAMMYLQLPTTAKRRRATALFLIREPGPAGFSWRITEDPARVRDGEWVVRRSGAWVPLATVDPPVAALQFDDGHCEAFGRWWPSRAEFSRQHGVGQ